MNKTELSKLLTTFSIIDHRQVEPETVNMWFAIVGDLDVEFAYQAGVDHFRESTEYLKPAHIVDRAKRLAAKNSADVREGKDRGVIPEGWSTSKKLTTDLLQALEADKRARRGSWIGRRWYESWDAYEQAQIELTR